MLRCRCSSTASFLLFVLLSIGAPFMEVAFMVCHHVEVAFMVCHHVFSCTMQTKRMQSYSFFFKIANKLLDLFVMRKIFYNIFLVNVVAVLVVFGAYESICCYFYNVRNRTEPFVVRSLLCGMIKRKSVGSKY